MALLQRNELGTAQHFLECDKKDCEKNCEYYCNHCCQRLCRPCRDEHKKTSKYKKHEVVLYQQRIRSFRVEKCRIHPTKDKDMLCEECQVQLCSKCATQKDHRGHTFIDLETMYTTTYARCREEISKIQQYFLPTSREIQRDINEDSRKIKKIMDSIRTSVKVDSDGLKSLVDRLASKNIQRVNNREKSLMENLKSQEKKITGYISYLTDLDKELQKYLSQTKPPTFTSSISEKLKIQSISEIPRLATPVFTAAQYNKDNVAQLLGKIDISNSEAENRHIKPSETTT
ncbi:RING finger protein 207-like, partial [Saccostrea echinata]|uniref:RING finger protein 207-like n=1 Tax=Saccostrea echinata TaxID=191078 RepID=UPI002A8130F3